MNHQRIFKLDFEQTTAAERRELIKETNSEQTIFKGSELNERLMNIRDDLLTRQLLTFTKRPYVGWKLLMQQEKEVKIKLKYTLMIHDDNLESLEHVDQGLLEKYSPTECLIKVLFFQLNSMRRLSSKLSKLI